MKAEFIIKGMHCHSCKVLIEEICNEINGVKSCHVEVKSGKAVIEHEGKLDLNKVKTEIESIGKYQVIFP